MHEELQDIWKIWKKKKKEKGKEKRRKNTKKKAPSKHQCKPRNHGSGFCTSYWDTSQDKPLFSYPHAINSSIVLYNTNCSPSLQNWLAGWLQHGVPIWRAAPTAAAKKGRTNGHPVFHASGFTVRQCDCVTAEGGACPQSVL